MHRLLWICSPNLLWYCLTHGAASFGESDSCLTPRNNDVTKGHSLLQKYFASQADAPQKVAAASFSDADISISVDPPPISLLTGNEVGHAPAPPFNNDDYIHDSRMGLGNPPSSSLKRTGAATSRSPSHKTGDEDVLVNCINSERRSIFQLRFKDVDKTSFWLILVLMLLFTIVIDRLEAGACWISRKSTMESRFVNRLNAELMMFGCVGLTLFVINSLVEFNSDSHLLIEFIDILCSLGACGLLAIAALLFVTRQLNDRGWQRLEEMYKLDNLSLRATSGQERSGLNKYVWGPTQPADYQVMAEHFRLVHKLPSTFRYHQYLNYVLLGNACDLMDIHWTSWVLLLAISAVFLGISIVRDRMLSTLGYALWFLAGCWLVFFAFTGMLCWTNWCFTQLMLHIHHFSATPDRALTEGDIAPPMTSRSGERMKFTMQFVSITSSFMLAFYIMHIRYNLEVARFGNGWHLLALAPLLVGLFGMLPIIISRFAVVEAFFSPNGEAIDDTLQDLHQLEDDLEYLRRLWRRQGSPSIPRREMLDEAAFGQMLRSFHMHMGPARLSRLFEMLDDNHNGYVDAQELEKHLQEARREDFDDLRFLMRRRVFWR
mmetsp:Transcript_10980/g.19092  ORF Transcript_10980/g.19092 Transcript_10980/m.19092 type:complete len:603 (+) Transcript_10980:34-1842(+)